jgi:hypothetical protein
MRRLREFERHIGQSAVHAFPLSEGSIGAGVTRSCARTEYQTVETFFAQIWDSDKDGKSSLRLSTYLDLVRAIRSSPFSH